MQEHNDNMNENEIEVEAIGIEVNTQPIELYKVLKIANVVSGGGEAKHIISEGYVAVNGEIEQRKRRKMYDGDVIQFDQEYYVVLYNEPINQPITDALSTKDENKQSKKSTKKATEEIAPSSKNGRKRITFF